MPRLKLGPVRQSPPASRTTRRRCRDQVRHLRKTTLRVSSYRRICPVPLQPSLIKVFYYRAGFSSSRQAFYAMHVSWYLFGCARYRSPKSVSDKGPPFDTPMRDVTLLKKLLHRWRGVPPLVWVSHWGWSDSLSTLRKVEGAKAASYAHDHVLDGARSAAAVSAGLHIITYTTCSFTWPLWAPLVLSSLTSLLPA